MLRNPLTVFILFVALAACGPTPAAHAQEDSAVSIELTDFGVNKRYRRGEINTLRFTLTSNRSEAEDAWIQVEIPNVDGDIVEYGSRVTLVPMSPVDLRLYVPVHWEMANNRSWPVRVFAYEDGARQREIASSRISPIDCNANPVFDGATTFGIIGTTNELGLRNYATARDSSNLPYAGHEPVNLVGNIALDDLPDRWEGLRMFDTLVWAGAPATQLRNLQAVALKDYVRRGGHLVIVLSSAGDEWQLGSSTKVENDIAGLLPQTAPRRDEDSKLSEVLPLISKAKRAERSNGSPIEFTVPLMVFKEIGKDFDVIDNHYEPLMALPDGRVPVVQRWVGHGLITVVGIDLTNQLSAVPLSSGVSGLPEADVFWNRILGWRRDTPSAREIAAMENDGILAHSSGGNLDLGAGKLMTSQIGMSGQAAIGLLFAAVLFIAYWVVAGPGGFFVLKSMSRARHAWVAFAGSALVFTLIAWVVVTTAREDDVKVKHITVLDHVYVNGDRGDLDPQFQRAISWMSLQLPGYGRAAVTVNNSDDQERDLLESWSPPKDPQQTFPDTTRYRSDVRKKPARFDQYARDEIDEYSVPRRSTATLMHANWMGGLPADWGGMIRPDAVDPLRIEIGLDGRESLVGSVVHDLPGSLTDVVFIWVRNQRLAPRRFQEKDGKEIPMLDRARSARMLNNGQMFSVTPRAWLSGSKVDIGKIREATAPGDLVLSVNIQRSYYEPFKKVQFGTSPPLTSGTQLTYLRMLSIFNQIDPPVYRRNQSALDPDTAHFVRELGRDLDLSQWFNRPCVIVMGMLEDSDIPIPLQVDGETPETEAGSRTFVRWIYPLPLIEEIAFADVLAQDEEDGVAPPAK